MPRNDVLVRAIRVLRAMEKRRIRMTHLELARELGCSQRTAARWLSACYEARVPMPPTLREVD